jgi:hypothetical protein
LVAFAIGVLAVYLVGGLVLVLGRRELLRTAVRGVDIPGVHFASLAAGAILITVAAMLWTQRARWLGPGLSERALRPRSTCPPRSRTLAQSRSS